MSPSVCKPTSSSCEVPAVLFNAFSSLLHRGTFLAWSSWTLEVSRPSRTPSDNWICRVHLYWLSVLGKAVTQGRLTPCGWEEWASQEPHQPPRVPLATGHTEANLCWCRYRELLRPSLFERKVVNLDLWGYFLKNQKPLGSKCECVPTSWIIWLQG